MSGEQAAPRDAEQLLEEMPCGLLVTRMDGTIVRVNATFCRWIGMSAAELVGAKKLQELLTVGARIFHQTHWLPMLQMQGSISNVSPGRRCREGNYYYRQVRNCTSQAPGARLAEPAPVHLEKIPEFQVRVKTL